MKLIEKIKDKIRGRQSLDELRAYGFECGENFHLQEGVIIDPGHCFLITIGNNVTLAPRVHILAHDASTKMILGYTRIAPVTIGDNVFIGAGSIVLPGVTIGNNVVIGAGSIVAKNCEEGYVYAGNPARKLKPLSDYIAEHRSEIAKLPCYDESFTIDNGTKEKFDKIKFDLGREGKGYIK
ncbi:acetyltransferase [Adlercreutzia equolifaciens subsp. celatus]|uniref:Acetyltransferase n=1 Tax=Adlercreutzia equolifaciens subsp. celatus TaxID=394340 RepID=A0A369NYU8_9ACTN|nr:acyltransferase [Adlercreutzia equolifaciens]RDC44676.1 acetyltransferase [Adlercreutzia equolifaciens subsp. celatus]